MKLNEMWEPGSGSESWKGGGDKESDPLYQEMSDAMNKPIQKKINDIAERTDILAQSLGDGSSPLNVEPIQQLLHDIKGVRPRTAMQLRRLEFIFHRVMNMRKEMRKRESN